MSEVPASAAMPAPVASAMGPAHPHAGRAQGVTAMRYAIVIEKSQNNHGAWAPDLPGGVAVGDTVEDVEQLMREAIVLHLAGMREDGDPIPPPVARVNDVDVAA